jgi:hypothetical protein
MLQTAETVSPRRGITLTRRRAWRQSQKARWLLRAASGRFAGECADDGTRVSAKARRLSPGSHHCVDEGIRPADTAGREQDWRHCRAANTRSAAKKFSTVPRLRSDERDARSPVRCSRWASSAAAPPVASPTKGIGRAFACPASRTVKVRFGLGVERGVDTHSRSAWTADGGAIAVGHPYGVSGARLMGHALIGASAA